MPLSFVTVTWNSGAVLRPLLESIQQHHPGSEIVVVDNGSRDDTVNIARSSKQARLIETGYNAGFATGNNIGVRAARHEDIVLINPDCLVLDTSLRELADLARDRRRVCGPRMLNADHSVQPSASGVPGDWLQLLRILVPEKLLPRAIQRRIAPWRLDEEVEVGWLTGACLVSPRELLLDLGPFDEREHLYGEDIDLGLRARTTGRPCVFAPKISSVIHLGDHASSQRFADAGVECSLRTRRDVVRRNLGKRRELLDYTSELGLHASRVIAKRALGRDVRPERAWIQAHRSARRERRALM